MNHITAFIINHCHRPIHRVAVHRWSRFHLSVISLPSLSFSSRDSNTNRSRRLVIMEVNDDNEEEFEFSRNCLLAKELSSSSKKSTNKLSDIDVVSEEELRAAASKLEPQHEKEVKTLIESYRRSYPEWAFVLRCDFGLLMYGFGSKKALLEDFACTALTEHAVIVINGYLQSINLKHVLITLAELMLDQLKTKRKTAGSLPEVKQPLSSRSVDDLLAFLEGLHVEENDYFVCVLVHNIDGPGLRDSDNQQHLARMAACSHVRIIASIDNINAPLLWDKKMEYTQFNWYWCHVPTFAPFKIEGMFYPMILAQGSTSQSAKTAEIVLQSLTPNARSVFKVLAEYQLAHPDEEGMPVENLYTICQERFIVSSQVTLNSHLAEFKDHDLVKKRKHSDGHDCCTKHAIAQKANPCSLDAQWLEIVLETASARIECPSKDASAMTRPILFLDAMPMHASSFALCLAHVVSFSVVESPRSYSVVTNRSEKLENPEFLCGQACQSKKGEDFTLLETECQRIVGDGSTSYSVFGVFDGHKGSAAAIYTKKNILNNILNAIPSDLHRDEWIAALPRALVAGFVKTDKDFLESGQESGTTATFVIIDGRVVTVASVGDSNCILESAEGGIYCLSADHRLEDNVEERERVSASGGEVGRLNTGGGTEIGPLRCWPGGLCLSRSIGDRDVGEFIVPVPFVKQVKLSTAGGRLIISSDGVWDNLSIESTLECCRGMSAEAAAAQVVKEAIHAKGLRDDTTCIIVDILPSEKKSPPLPPPKKQGSGFFRGLFRRKSSESLTPANTEYLEPDVVEEMFEAGSATLSERLDSKHPLCHMFKLSLCAVCQVKIKRREGVSVHADSSNGAARPWDGPFLCLSCHEKKEAMEGKRPSGKRYSSESD
ncbi:hypothetical protein Nepgr_025072 [Nepenthes gracilis]|uniref:protein-serine/threonine phosphatase n=1 Tax=Nepenthes gracilis TaxID=150966 RepID=A0AAD3T5L4_NEPGR|nr:hypothetical protein Nepgr_025072 [Nepenthes gracilis]